MQIRSPILVRVKKHLGQATFSGIDKSSVAQQIRSDSLKVGLTKIKLSKHVRNNKYLDSWKRLFIHRNGNSDNGPIPYFPLFSLLFSKCKLLYRRDYDALYSS